MNRLKLVLIATLLLGCGDGAAPEAPDAATEPTTAPLRGYLHQAITAWCTNREPCHEPLHYCIYNNTQNICSYFDCSTEVDVDVADDLLDRCLEEIDLLVCGNGPDQPTCLELIELGEEL